MTSDNGVPPIFHSGPAVRATVDLPADLARALDVWAASQANPPDREATILFALRDWLTGLGILPAGSDVSEGLH